MLKSALVEVLLIKLDARGLAGSVTLKTYKVLQHLETTKANVKYIFS